MLLLFTPPATVIAAAFVLSLTIPVTAQPALPPASECFAPVTFTGCDTLSLKISECNNLPPSATSSDYAACFCTQEVFNAITDCESETRMCARSPNNDYWYDDLRTQWLKTCGPKITFALTTPVLSNYAYGTFSDLSCTSTAISACQSVQYFGSQCSSSYQGTTASGYYSCACQDEVVSQASLCEIFGASCLGHTIVTSTLFIYQYCGFGHPTSTPMVVSTIDSQSQQTILPTSGAASSSASATITSAPPAVITSTLITPTTTTIPSTTTTSLPVSPASTSKGAAASNQDVFRSLSWGILPLVALQNFMHIWN
ncbi:hypothetical protein OIDMADRAFT_181965 [Oidiodendron maius Zn]|uniref:Extracellular membrane protein CFEM domain-containing protein n=1 Tax=Oidiodendron maius (strain Zn) TaxID=913774 RepID=A0A0C3H8M2_OIDMZ|nr:hypothetical protein OIDMADRAFT_181965 [Oidiodendron maius Zn]